MIIIRRSFESFEKRWRFRYAKLCQCRVFFFETRLKINTLAVITEQFVFIFRARETRPKRSHTRFLTCTYVYFYISQDFWRIFDWCQFIGYLTKRNKTCSRDPSTAVRITIVIIRAVVEEYINSDQVFENSKTYVKKRV